MKLENLKNYGVGLSRQLSALPSEVKKSVARLGTEIIFDEVGFMRIPKLIVIYFAEKRRMKRVDLSPVKEMGLDDEQFIREQITLAAVFSAIKRTAGADKANEIIRLLSERIGGDTLEYVMPAPDDFLEFKNPFHAFRDYLTSVAEGDNREGCHRVEIVENTGDNFQMNITYCVWYDIYRRLGVPEACLVSCYSDEVLLPNYLKPLGARFVRTGTIAGGAPVCDFRFERTAKK
ncbi:MAG: L-2-amino-thiazoline-4-carboxylic acid hydrolase [Deltaproteobacteria bacterium]|uniref:L-2-amino-thiazoline-4-carboxylic acid hydrolase n=1 Tax=Candidatus Zymogenus saltonus TaxID=2844893 RepID=A0A9D8KFG9_9DELT|nr:L-2-amino-thiazoline-4-carboxylic acid hydrolase [Candidatus Zymogenus saltonus]